MPLNIMSLSLRFDTNVKYFPSVSRYVIMTATSQGRIADEKQKIKDDVILTKQNNKQ